MNKGKIKISKDILKDPEAHQSILPELFSKFIPVHIENDPFETYNLYSGYSKYFDLQDEGSPVPEYDAVITMTDEKVSVRFNKV